MDERIHEILHRLGDAERVYRAADEARNQVITELYLLVEKVCKEREDVQGTTPK